MSFLCLGIFNLKLFLEPLDLPPELLHQVIPLSSLLGHPLSLRLPLSRTLTSRLVKQSGLVTCAFVLFLQYHYQVPVLSVCGLHFLELLGLLLKLLVVMLEGCLCLLGTLLNFLEEGCLVSVGLLEVGEGGEGLRELS